MQARKQAVNRPLIRDTADRKPLIFREYRMGNAQRNAGHRRGLERQMKARDASGMHVDSKGEPGTLNRCSIDRVDDNDIDQGVIDLDQGQGCHRFQRPLHRSKLVACLLVPVPARGNFPSRLGSQAFRNRLATRRLDAEFQTSPSDATNQVAHPRPLASQVI